MTRDNLSLHLTLITAAPTVRDMLHLFVDASYYQETRKAGAGVCATLAQNRAVLFNVELSGCRSSMQAELRAAEIALQWARPGSDVVLAVDNRATMQAILAQPALFWHLGNCFVTYQPHSRAWPMQQAHTLAQQAAKGELVAEHTVTVPNLPQLFAVAKLR